MKREHNQVLVEKFLVGSFCEFGVVGSFRRSIKRDRELGSDRRETG